MIYPDIYQGDYPVNLAALRQRYDRILIRAAFGATEDTKFRAFWNEAGALGFKRQAYQRIKHWPGAPSISRSMGR